MSCPHRPDRIAATDRAANAVQFAGDLPGQVGGGLIEKQDVLRADGLAEILDFRSR